MPPISHPPPTWRRFASAVTFVITIIFLCIFFRAIIFFHHLLLPTPHPSAAPAPAQLASTPLSDDFSSSSTLGHVTSSTLVAFAVVGLFLVLFLFLVIAFIVTAVLLHPEDRSVRPLRLLGAPRGVDSAVIETFPTVVYSAVKGHKIGQASLECAVCLNDFKDDDTLRLIRKCNHAFHPDCISAWLASHTTCPVCRADPRSQPASDLASQLAESGTEPPPFEVKVEASPSDGRAPERSPREGGRKGVYPPYLRDNNESGSFNNRTGIRGSGRIRRFPRSHSTGHPLIRQGEDFEHFTLRLPAEVWKQLMNQPGPVLSLEGCPRRGYRCGGEGSSQGRYFWRPDRLGLAAKSDRWDFNRILPRVAADGGGGSFQGSVQQARRSFSA